jgi:hypothetical protein
LTCKSSKPAHFCTPWRFNEPESTSQKANITSRITTTKCQHSITETQTFSQDSANTETWDQPFKRISETSYGFNRTIVTLLFRHFSEVWICAKRKSKVWHFGLLRKGDGGNMLQCRASGISAIRYKTAGGVFLHKG